MGFTILLISRSQRPRRQMRRSTAARLMRSWVRIPLGAWMFVCCVLSGRGLCDELNYFTDYIHENAAIVPLNRSRWRTSSVVGAMFISCLRSVASIGEMIWGEIWKEATRAG
jgi:hypothetical protein